jgi:hypothetical protein
MWQKRTFLAGGSITAPRAGAAAAAAAVIAEAQAIAPAKALRALCEAPRPFCLQLGQL